LGAGGLCWKKSMRCQWMMAEDRSANACVETKSSSFRGPFPQTIGTD
jgi:hypothetical protein